MNRSVWLRTGVGAAVLALLALSGQAVRAEEDDSLSLKIANALKPDRFFMRAGAIHIKVKTKSGDTYDVTGPVVRRAELEKIFNEGLTAEQNEAIAQSLIVPTQFYRADGTVIPRTPEQIAQARLNVIEMLRDPDFGVPAILNSMTRDELVDLGTPEGIRTKAASSMSTAGLSLGYYLDEARTWALEAYVLASPISTSAYGDADARRNYDPEGEVVRPPAINGKKIVTTKLLPPTVTFGKYWNVGRGFSLYTGAIATYAIFFDTKATDYLNNYVGGTKPGDTTVSIKNAFGAGPTLGFKYQFDDQWHFSFNVGHVKLKTQATLVTKNTMFTNSTPVTRDLGYHVSETIEASLSAYVPVGGSLGTIVDRQIMQASGGAVGATMRLLAGYRGDSSLGTYVRKTDLELTNTIFMLSVGRSF